MILQQALKKEYLRSWIIYPLLLIIPSQSFFMLPRLPI